MANHQLRKIFRAGKGKPKLTSRKTIPVKIVMISIGIVAADLGISCNEAEELISNGEISYDVETGKYYRA